MKTARGFEVKHFEDLYNQDCSIQESSLATDDCIWLGVHTPKIRVMCKDMPAFIGKLNVLMQTWKDIPDCGWYEINLPKEAFVDSRMHLNRSQAANLIDELKFFVETGRLSEEDPNLQKMPYSNLDLYKSLEDSTGLHGKDLEALLASNDDTTEPTIRITPNELWDIAHKHHEEERRNRWRKH